MAERARPRSFERSAALARAMEVLWAKGYDGASIADLTAAMGINPPSLCAAFGSKDSLFRAAVDFDAMCEGAEIAAAIEGAPTARDAVDAYLMVSAANLARPGKPTGCMTVLSALNATDANVDVRRELHETRAQSRDVIERRLRSAIDTGELAPTLDCRSIATFFVTVQQGMSIQARDGASQAALEGIAKSAMAAWATLTGATA